MKDIPIISISNGGNESFIRDGMTLRDYFAAKAMQGFAAACANENDFESWIDNNRGMAKSAYEWADVMMKAREL
jgi:hypothetical protein